jgi:hypothetical protein
MRISTTTRNARQSSASAPPFRQAGRRGDRDQGRAAVGQNQVPQGKNRFNQNAGHAEKPGRAGFYSLSGVLLYDIGSTPMTTEDRKPPPRRIDIGTDILLLDEDFCDELLAGATRRTAKRLEAEGLPYVFVAGRKYRPLREGQEFLAARIRRPNPKRGA